MHIQSELKGLVFKISRCSSEDGPGLRTTVFLKGCPLRCIWCHSPESQKYEPEIAFYENRCIRCGACSAECPQDAQIVSRNERQVLWNKCNHCGDCVAVCPSLAMDIVGEYREADEVVRIIQRDQVYFSNSGGGVTFSGGEPMAQPHFLKWCLQRCAELGIHTAVETCGYVKWTVLEELLPFIDLFLYDLKHMDSAKHKELTGVGNELILENLKNIDSRGKTIWIRVPLITGCNDSIENIKQLAEFVSALNNVTLVSLLPYNTAAGAGYINTGREYALEHLGLYDRDKGKELLKPLLNLGIKAELC